MLRLSNRLFILPARTMTIVVCVLIAACGRSRGAGSPGIDSATTIPPSNHGPAGAAPSAAPNPVPTPQAPPPVPVNPVPLERMWRHPANLQANISFDNNDADSGALATGGGGDAMIAWEYGSRIYASERRGRIWRHPVQGVSQPFNPAGGNMFDIDIAMDPRGDTVMVWAQKDAGIARIYKSEYHAGVWTNPATLANHISPLGNDAQLCRVTMASNGDAIVVWEQYATTGNGRIFKSELRAGVWTHPTSENDRISPDVTNAQDVSLAIGPNGHAIVVWAQGDAHHYRIFKSERRNGIWTHPATTADCISPDGTNAYLPVVAFDGAGNAVIAWVQSDGTTQQVFKAEYRAGVWSYPTSLTDNISPDGTTAHKVAVAASSNGNAVIVWRQDTGGPASRLFKSEYRAGTWVHPTSLAAPFGIGPTVAEFAVAMDAAGVVIAYTATDGTQPLAMYLSEYRGGQWRHATSISEHISPAGPDTTLPRVSIDGDGDVVVLWRQSTGANGHAFMSEYRAF